MQNKPLNPIVAVIILCIFSGGAAALIVRSVEQVQWGYFTAASPAASSF